MPTAWGPAPSPEPARIGPTAQPCRAWSVRSAASSTPRDPDPNARQAVDRSDWQSAPWVEIRAVTKSSMRQTRSGSHHNRNARPALTFRRRQLVIRRTDGHPVQRSKPFKLEEVSALTGIGIQGIMMDESRGEVPAAAPPRPTGEPVHHRLLEDPRGAVRLVPGAARSSTPSPAQPTWKRSATGRSDPPPSIASFVSAPANDLEALLDAFNTRAFRRSRSGPTKPPFLAAQGKSQDKESRQYFIDHLVGKMISLLAVIALAYVFMKFIGDDRKTLAQDASTCPADPLHRWRYQPLNTAWMLGAAVLHGGHDRRTGVRQPGPRGAGDGQHPRRECIVDTAPVRPPLLGLRLRLHVRQPATAASATEFFFLQRRARRPTAPTGDGASWRSSCSSSPSPTPARRSRRAPWSAARGFKGDLLYSFGVRRLHLPDHRPLDLGPGRWLAGTMDTPFPRLRRLDRGAHRRRRARPRRRHRPRPPPRPQVQARRRRPCRRPRPDPRAPSAA